MSGSLTYSPPTPPNSADALWVAGTFWSAYTATMAWEVTDEDNSYAGFPWKYTYNFKVTHDGTLQGAISHLIIEVSEGMSVQDIAGVTGGAVLAANPVQLQNVGSGNPGMPEDLWGIRFDPSAAQTFDMTWSFWSNRVPVWGDFYVKDGGNPTNIAYNYNNTGTIEKGFLSPDSDPDALRSSDPTGLYHILRPDSLVPEPGTLVLLVSASLGLLRCARRRRS